jgi:hypothetical protein
MRDTERKLIPSFRRRENAQSEHLAAGEHTGASTGDTLTDIPTVPTPVVLKENNQWQTDPGYQTADLNAAQSQQTAIEAVIATAAAKGVEVVADEKTGSVEVSTVINPPYVPWVRPADMPPGSSCASFKYNMIVANAAWDSPTSWDRGSIPTANGQAIIDLPTGSTAATISSLTGWAS